MQVTVAKDALVAAIAIAAKASPTATTVPVITGVMLETPDASTMRVTGTDLQVGVEVTVASTNFQMGKTVVPARLFNELIRRLPSADITLTSDSPEGILSVRPEGGNKAEFGIRTYAADEFPPFPDVPKTGAIACTSAQLRNLVKMTAFAASADESRPFLTGVQVVVEGSTMVMVATDSWRLSLKQTPLVGDGQLSALVPAKALSELARALPESDEQVSMFVSGNQICFETAGLRFVSRLVEGQFPNYRNILPKAQSRRAKLTVSRHALLSAAERAALMLRERVSLVRMTNSDATLIITANSPDMGTTHEELPIVGEGEEVRIVLDARYLIEALRAVDTDDVIVSLQGSQQAMSISDSDSGDYTHLIMPVKVPV